jgi:hypothetical protein
MLTGRTCEKSLDEAGGRAGDEAEAGKLRTAGRWGAEGVFEQVGVTVGVWIVLRITETGEAVLRLPGGEGGGRVGGFRGAGGEITGHALTERLTGRRGKA